MGDAVVCHYSAMPIRLPLLRSAIARVQHHAERGRGVCQLVPLVVAVTKPPSSDSSNGNQRGGAEYGRGVDARYLKRPTAGHVGGKGHVAHLGERLG